MAILATDIGHITDTLEVDVQEEAVSLIGSDEKLEGEMASLVCAEIQDRISEVMAKAKLRLGRADRASLEWDASMAERIIAAAEKINEISTEAAQRLRVLLDEAMQARFEDPDD